MKNKKLSLLIVAILVFTLFATACAPSTQVAEEPPAPTEASAEVPDEEPIEEPSEETNQEAEPETRIVIDHSGNEVEIPNEVNRVVVSNFYPFPSVISMYLGSGEKIVGMPPLAMSSVEEGIMGQIYPELLEAETSFSSDGTINAESLLELDPDVAFYIAGTPDQEVLENAGIPAIAISASNWGSDCIKTYEEWVKLLAQVFPEQEGKTQEVIDYSNQVYDMIQERIADIPEDERVRAMTLYSYSDEGKNVSGDTFADYWTTSAGGYNVGIELGEGVSRADVNMEQIYDWDPEVIFITNFTPAQPEDLYNNAIGVDDWSSIQAVENDKVYKMPLGSYRSYTPGVDVPLTLLWTAKSLYPDLFADIDMDQEVKDYYKNIYDVDLTDEDVTAMFNPSSEASEGDLHNKS